MADIMLPNFRDYLENILFGFCLFVFNDNLPYLSDCFLLLCLEKKKFIQLVAKENLEKIFLPVLW